MSIALYRRYRPEKFEEVIGQDHVIDPLMAALEAGRTTHAYLFSGPRGCGKTTSARILARCLNCAEYPTPTPCGECESCRELARDGSGSLDVVELDAASHGGVDDARELREQASFAPVRDRFKIFIIDEAHMVTTQGFNALLKLVEEPPPHVKFIFATTEPEKVIGTIRSRTHHYPFRLVPPPVLEQYLAQICHDEGIDAPREVLSLVVRAGTGSVRDTLSVLDQIIGGSDGVSLDYERAVALLGYTSAHLLDEAITAVGHNDGPALFQVVDSIVASGHDPRRFVEDLLQRLRDLVILSLAGESARDVFVQVPDDQFAAMVSQAELIGAKRASLCADFTNEALSTMAGATAPRLQLELLCARLLVQTLPEASHGNRGSLSAVQSGTAGSVPNVQSAAQNVVPNSAGQSGARANGNLSGKGIPSSANTAHQQRTLIDRNPENRDFGANHSPVNSPVNPLVAPMPSFENPLGAPMPSAAGAQPSSESHHATASSGSGVVRSEATDSRNLRTVNANSGKAGSGSAQAAKSDAAKSPEFVKIAENWDQVLQLADSKSAAVAEIMTHSRGVAALEKNVLSIFFESEKWARQFDQTIPALDVIARAVYAKTGLKTRVRGVVGTAQPVAVATQPMQTVFASQNISSAKIAVSEKVASSARFEATGKSASSAPETAHMPAQSASDSRSETGGQQDPKGEAPQQDAERSEGDFAVPQPAVDSAGDSRSTAKSTAVQNETAVQSETENLDPAGVLRPLLEQVRAEKQPLAQADEQPFYRQTLPAIPPISQPGISLPVAAESESQTVDAAAAGVGITGEVAVGETAVKAATAFNTPTAASAAAVSPSAFSSDAFASLRNKQANPVGAAQNHAAAATLSQRLAAHIDATAGEDVDPFAQLNARGPAAETEFGDAENAENEWDEVSIYDPSVSEADFVGVNVVLAELGGKVIEEIPHRQNQS